MLRQVYPEMHGGNFQRRRGCHARNGRRINKSQGLDRLLEVETDFLHCPPVLSQRLGNNAVETNQEVGLRDL